MSDASDVIKEFLVSLGFRIDEAGLKRFNLGIAKGSSLALGFGAAVTAMAAAVVAGVGQVSRKFEDLYYLSMRVGSSAENINGLTFAFSQLGGTADQAKAAMAAVQNFLTLLPAGGSVLEGWGIKTRNANGEMRDTAEILQDLGKRWRDMPFYQANVEAGMLGIDTETLRVLTRDTDRFFEQYKKHVRETGVDQEEAAAASARMMQRIRELWSVVVLFADALLLKLQPAFEALAEAALKLYGRFKEWNDGSSESRRAVGELFMAVGDLLGALLELAKALWTVIGPAVTTFAQGALTVITDSLTTLAHLVRLISALLRGDWSTAWKEAKEVAANTLKTLVDFAMTLFNTVRKVWYAVTHKGAAPPPAETAPATGAAAGAPPAAVAAAATTGTATGTPVKRALDYFRSKGWSAQAAAGIVANLQAESGMRIGAVGDGGKAFGLAQWHPDRQAAFKRWAGKDIRDSTFEEQLAFVHYELTGGMDVGARKAGRLLLGARTAKDAGRIVTRYYERPADTAGEMARRGDAASRLFGAPALRGSSPATTLAQTTTITVVGSADPAATGREVAAQQGRVNAEMVRQVKVAAS